MLIVVLSQHFKVHIWMTVYVSSIVSSLLSIHNSINYWNINNWNWFSSPPVPPWRKTSNMENYSILFYPVRVCIEIEFTSNDNLSWPSLAPPYEIIPKLYKKFYLKGCLKGWLRKQNLSSVWIYNFIGLRVFKLTTIFQLLLHETCRNLGLCRKKKFNAIKENNLK